MCSTATQTGSTGSGFNVMDSDAHLKFDGFLVQHDDPLAYEAGTPYSRWVQKATRMLELEQERRAKADGQTHAL